MSYDYRQQRTTSGFKTLHEIGVLFRKLRRNQQLRGRLHRQTFDPMPPPESNCPIRFSGIGTHKV
jgi:hypothetical protein